MIKIIYSVQLSLNREYEGYADEKLTVDKDFAMVAARQNGWL